MTTPIQPREGFAQANGLRFHYLAWGAPGKPYLYLLHGGGQSAHSWDDVAPALAQRFHVVAPDQRGHGDSDWATDGDYSHGAQAKDIIAIADALGMQRFALMGLSMGGRNALVVAVRHPERIEKLVVIDVGPEVMREGARAIKSFVAGGLEKASFEDFVRDAKAFNPRRSEENLRQRLRHTVKQLPSGTWTWKHDIRHLAAAGREPFEVTFKKLGDITLPTLIVRGGESNILSPEAAVRMEKSLPNARLVTVEGASHSVMGDNPSGFLAAVRPFLAAVRPFLEA
ncbi:MAG: alpha/beta hydrolase [Chloroflexi bacterium]|nr:alpha/beta hydrolase [Chloroflexota bacterium]